MAKILLVEDDKSLREIYGVRLMAEGYNIISAGDGEEALAVAIKERPDLIVSDVMMPKISGFDMLDILRSTTETKDIKVIMMTALSSEDQRARGEALGADRYLVKSQVGIEDVVRTVHDVLGDSITATPAFPPATTPVATTPAEPAPAPAAAPTVNTVAPQPITAPQPVATVVDPTPAAFVPTPTPPVAYAPTPTPIVAPDTTPLPTPAPYVAPVVAPVSAPVTPAPTAIPAPQPITAPQPVATVVDPTPAAFVPTPTPASFQTPVTPAPAAPFAPQPASPTPVATPVQFPPSSLPEPTAPFSTNPPASLADRIINPLPSADTLGQSVGDIATQMNKELNAHLQELQQPAVATTPPQPPVPPFPPQPGI